jgi:transposase
MMRFYQHSRQFYCGIDLHAKQMFVCVLNQAGEIVLHRNLPADGDVLRRVLEPFRDGLVIGVECTFSWYWLADWCRDEKIEFVLGHALYMKAIHGGKAKNDKIDSEKIARLLRGGTFPLAYAYPKEMRGTRDLLRRRTFLVRRRAELLAHVQNTYTQYNISSRNGRGRDRLKDGDPTAPFTDESVQYMLRADVSVIEHLDETIVKLESHLIRHAKIDDPIRFQLLKTIPGVGPVLALVMLYEVHDIERFDNIGQFVSYARLVACAHESAGKKLGSGGRKIGNAHLKWAFGEAAALMIRTTDEAKAFMEKMTKQRGKARAVALLAAKIGRAVYWMMKRKQPFDAALFWKSVLPRTVAKTTPKKGVKTAAKTAAKKNKPATAAS